MTVSMVKRSAFQCKLLRLFELMMAVLTVLCVSVPGLASDEETGETVSFAARSVYDGGTVKNAGKILTDGKVKNYCDFPAGGALTVTFPKDAEPEYLYLEWFTVPTQFGCTCFDGTRSLLSSSTFAGEEVYRNDSIFLPGGTHSVIISLPDGGQLSTCIPGAGQTPLDWHPWMPTAEKTDYLIVSMHPDDDVLFMGAVTPILSDGGFTGSILYLSASERERVTEALNGAWTMGQRHYPLFGDLPDYPSIDKYKTRYKDSFTVDLVMRSIVHAIRRVKPEVLITHSITGEYGHWQHIITSEAALVAVQNAADPSFDPASAEIYGTWQVKKLYRHLDEECVLTLDVERPLSSFEGKTAWDVAQEAYTCHKTQQDGRHKCSNEGVYTLTRFSLVWSTVGEDARHDGFFENINERDLTTYAEPEPTPEPTALPTVEPDPVLTPDPVSVSVTVPDSTPAPVAAETDMSVKSAASLLMLAIAAGGLVAALVLIIAITVRNGKKSRR